MYSLFLITWSTRLLVPRRFGIRNLLRNKHFNIEPGNGCSDDSSSIPLRYSGWPRVVTFPWFQPLHRCPFCRSDISVRAYLGRESFFLTDWSLVHASERFSPLSSVSQMSLVLCLGTSMGRSQGPALVWTCHDKKPCIFTLIRILGSPRRYTGLVELTVIKYVDVFVI